MIKLFSKKSTKTVYAAKAAETDRQSDSSPSGLDIDAAIARHQAGDLAYAESVYKQCIDNETEIGKAAHFLGILRQQQGNLPEAIRLLEHSVQVEPGNIGFLSNLGLAHLAVGGFDKAIASLQEAVRINPKNPHAGFNLAVCYLKQGNVEQARAWCERVLEIDRSFVYAYNQLADLEKQRGDYDKAIAYLESSIKHNPQLPESLLGLADLWIKKRDLSKAMGYCERVLQLTPDSAEANWFYGEIYNLQGNASKAIQAFEKAISFQPGMLEAHNSLGLVFSQTGEFDKALAYFDAALRIAPNSIEIRYNHSLIQDAGYAAFAVDEIESLLKQSDGSPAQQIPLYFSLGGLYEKQGEYNKAFDSYAKGNRLKRTDFQRAKFDRLVDDQIRYFTREYFQGTRHSDVDSEQPLFIVGMPRSGTTLVEQILSSHPRVHGAGERLTIPSFIDELSRQGTVPFTQGLENTDFAALAQTYLDEVRIPDGNIIRTTDKLPANFLYLGFIALLFPRARVIHCQRHPLDTCLSCYFQNFEPLQPYADDLESLGYYYLTYRRIMDHWHRVLPLRMLTLRYEDLVGQQEYWTRELVTFSGLEWHDSCLRYRENRRMVKTASSWQVRQPIYQSSIGRWKNYQSQLAQLTGILEDHHLL